MGASTQTWTSEMLEALDATRPIIASVLRPAGRTDEVGDVLSETWIAAEKSLPAFDPDRGPFGAWIATIARRQALRLIRRDVAAARLQESVEHAAASGITTVYDVAHEGFADELVERLADWEQMTQVLTVTRAVMVHPELLDRTLTLLIEHLGCVETAAAALRVKPAALRDTHRRVMDMTHVVEAALRTHQERRESGQTQQPVLIGQLLACLPNSDDSAQVAVMALTQALRCRGKLGAVTVEDMAGAAGWSLSTARQHLAHLRGLLQVALLVIQCGPGGILAEGENG
ncbi:sigma factor [Rothia kristinae]|uniref:sigma factor n=1 Tax=Rothia kristinae TaxID=37923 RepID=UPI00119E4876|nr:sigma factor [Rothia kristinae]